ncbi:uncharacterized protein LOC127246799 isoform X2 [Andrographis paniculata]|uniref:uncharacterized protein LOC127246799 isoform X2 n=1 Tax=Andrographis paniculata TaxID=175694 RepID=UPI0021E9150D|nr:uncharacterized protein LOC127246799 isoform X2 [Andrographis paniculata]
MASSMSSMIGHEGIKASPRIPTTPGGLSWNPISSVTLSKWKNEISFLGVDFHQINRRKSFRVSSNTVPGGPPPSGPPSSNSMRGILGLVVSFILPFFTNIWAPLGVFKHRIESAVQTVENIVEAVEEVAGKVDKIAEEIIDDLPQGKIRDLVEFVEDAAEATAKTADSLDDVIDKVQEVGDHVDDIVQSAVEDAKISPVGSN